MPHAGLVLAPMDFAPEEAKGLHYVPSMALGVLLAGPVLTAALIAARQAPPRLFPRVAGIWGTLAGVMWNAGNVSPGCHGFPLLSCCGAIG